MYLLGYLASQSKVYLMDKDFGVVPYTLLLSVSAPLLRSRRRAGAGRMRGRMAPLASSLGVPARMPGALATPWPPYRCRMGGRDHSVLSSVPPSNKQVVEYKTLVLRGDMETAADVLASIPQASCGAGLALGPSGPAPVLPPEP